MKISLGCTLTIYKQLIGRSLLLRFSTCHKIFAKVLSTRICPTSDDELDRVLCRWWYFVADVRQHADLLERKKIGCYPLVYPFQREYMMLDMANSYFFLKKRKKSHDCEERTAVSQPGWPPGKKFNIRRLF